jgi:hypothetical protein
VFIHLPGSRGTATGDYGKVMFFDVARRRAARISDASGCERAMTRFHPGAYFAG